MQYQKPDKGYYIYTKSQCPSCTEMKGKLPDAVYINCDEYLTDVDAFLDFLDTITDEGPTTFPIVFLDGKYISSDKVFTVNDEF